MVREMDAQTCGDAVTNIFDTQLVVQLNGRVVFIQTDVNGEHILSDIERIGKFGIGFKQNQFHLLMKYFEDNPTNKFIDRQFNRTNVPEDNESKEQNNNTHYDWHRLSDINTSKQEIALFHIDSAKHDQFAISYQQIQQRLIENLATAAKFRPSHLYFSLFDHHQINKYGFYVFEFFIPFHDNEKEKIYVTVKSALT